MGKNTLRKAFSNMYGEGKPLNNKSSNTLLKDLSSKLPSNSVSVKSSLLESSIENEVSKKDNEMYKNGIELYKIMPPIDTPTTSFWSVLIFIFAVIIVTVIYFLRAPIIAFIQSIEKNIEKTDSLEKKFKDMISSKPEEKEVKPKQNEQPDSIQKDIEEKKKKDEQESKGAVKEVKTNLDKLSGYSEKQTAKEDGFCFIGIDKGQRECTEIYNGEICMSGQIFPTLAVCTNPKLRS